jgi:hypothetical protein
MFNTIKQKLLDTMAAHPKLAIFGIGLAITFVIGTAIGMVNTPPAYAAHGLAMDGYLP